MWEQVTYQGCSKKHVKLEHPTEPERTCQICQTIFNTYQEARTCSSKHKKFDEHNSSFLILNGVKLIKCKDCSNYGIAK